MKTLIKLALVAIIANATWHLFVIYTAHWKFQDTVKYAAESRGRKTNEELKQEVLGIATQAELPIDEDHLTITLAETHTTVDTTYTRSVELFPGFNYPWPFTVHVDAYSKERLAK